ncbi:hypothetical protein Enr17x_54720 [Gimesia fumaroli]|uniref:Uncharacterized protein n=1 Tax=Gimesia fumaroli TaxID=2527976 RepID=A0A518IJW2_9PLAN|nr:hypothetical protein Enr17x_54720 [Gimesia fumaroli]
MELILKKTRDSNPKFTFQKLRCYKNCEAHICLIVGNMTLLRAHF